MQWSSCTHLGIKVSKIASGTAVSGALGARLRGSWPYGCNWPAHSAGDHTGLTPRYQRAALTPPQPDWADNPARQHIGAYFAATDYPPDITTSLLVVKGARPRTGLGPEGCNCLPRGKPSATCGKAHAGPLPRPGRVACPGSIVTKKMKRSPGIFTRDRSRRLGCGLLPAGITLPETGTGTPKIAAPSFKVAPMCGFLPLRRRWGGAAQLSRPGSIPRGLARTRSLPPLLSPRSAGSRPVPGSWGSGGRVPPPYSVGNGEIFATGFPLLAVMGCEYETADMQAVRPAVP